MKNNIVVLENVYNEDTYKALFHNLQKHPFSYFWGDVAGSYYWNSHLVDDTPVQQLCDKLLEEFSSKFNNMVQPYVKYINAQTYGLEPGPHYDFHSEDAVTVINYITDTWNITWGGETFLFNNYSHNEKDASRQAVDKLLFDPISIDAVITPAYNRTVIFPSNQLHTVRPLSRFFGGSRYTYMYKIKGITVEELMKGYNDN
jgi:2OG-Fe(II) oxygenase superfamily